MSTDSTADVHGKDNEREEYERAIRELRQDIGCTKERLAEHPLLVGALERSLMRRGKPTTIEECVDELRRLAADLSNPRHRDPLLVALRFHPDYQEEILTERRRRYIKNLMRTKQDVNIRTLERRENSGITTLAQQLTDSYAESDAATFAFATTPPVFNRGLRIESRETWYSFGPRKVMREVLISLRLIAVEPGKHVLSVQREYMADRREGVLEMIPEFACELDGEPWFKDDVTHVRFRIPRQMKTGDRHCIVYRIRIHSDKECRPILRTIPSQAELEVTHHIYFHPDAIPSELWSFAHLPLHATHDPEVVRQVRLPNQGSRYVSDTWRGLRVGLCYGTTWDWS